MEDIHDAVLDFEKAYEDTVSFYIGGLSRSPSICSEVPDSNATAKKGDSSTSQQQQTASDPSSGEGDRPSNTRKCSTSNQRSDPKQIMEIYEQREKDFTEQFLTASPSPTVLYKSLKYKRAFSQSPSRNRQSTGLEHLDNLVRMMEHLSQLKEENVNLKSKCGYLEDTKVLLEARNDMLRTDFSRSRSKKRSRGSQLLALGSSEKSKRERCNSDHSDQLNPVPPPPPTFKLTQRSQSVGSIDVVEDLSEEFHDLQRSRSADKDTTKESMKSPHNTPAKIKSRRFPKWHKMKRVFSTKGESSSNKDASITAEQLARSNSKPRIGSLPHVKSVDSALGIMSDLEKENTPQLDEPHSPDSVNSEPMVIPSVVTDGNDFFDGSTFGSVPHSPLRTTISTASSTTSEDYNKEIQNIFASGGREKSQFLSVESTHAVRRKSSPTLSVKDDIDIGKKKDSLSVSPSIGRSSSFKETKKQALDSDDTHKGKMHDVKKNTKSAWGRVKTIIHTRKDSFKMKNKRSHSAGDALQEASRYTDSESEPETNLRPSKSEVVQCRFEPEVTSSPKDIAGRKVTESALTPPRKRRNVDAHSPSDSPPPARKEQRPQSRVLTSSPSIDITALMGGMSEEFNRKMLDWEEKKRKGFTKEEVMKCTEKDGSSKFSDSFIRKMEEWEKIKGLGQAGPRSRQSMKEGLIAFSAPVTPPEKLEQSFLASEEIQKTLSESFSKTVQEWERIKTKRTKETGSPTNEFRVTEGRKSRKDVRSKSRDRSRERSRSKYEKIRERELQKIEKKEMKLEKEKQKLEKLKQKLDKTEGEVIKTDGLSVDFAQKLQEWEVIKGLKTETCETTQTFETHHMRTRSAKVYKDTPHDTMKERSLSDSSCLDQQMIQGPDITPELVSPAQAPATTPSPDSAPVSQSTSFTSGIQVTDDSTSIDSTLVTENLSKLEESNVQLRKEVEKKNDDLESLKYEMQQLTDRINEMNKDHCHEIEAYKRELWATSKIGKYTIESDLMANTLKQLQSEIDQLQDYSDTLVKEKQNLQKQIDEGIEAKQESDLEVMVEQLKSQTLPASGEEVQQKNVKLTFQDLDKLCMFLETVQMQLNNLNLGIMERNRILQNMKHHLLVQEVTNKLLQAEVDRKNLELQFYKDARKAGIIKRWKTFSGKDILIRDDGSLYLKNGTTVPLQMGSSGHHSYQDVEALLSDLKHGREEMTPLSWELLEALQKQKKAAQAKTLTELKACETQTHTETRNTLVQTTRCLSKSVATSVTDLRSASGPSARRIGDRKETAKLSVKEKVAKFSGASSKSEGQSKVTTTPKLSERKSKASLADKDDDVFEDRIESSETVKLQESDSRRDSTTSLRGNRPPLARLQRVTSQEHEDSKSEDEKQHGTKNKNTTSKHSKCSGGSKRTGPPSVLDLEASSNTDIWEEESTPPPLPPRRMVPCKSVDSMMDATSPVVPKSPDNKEPVVTRVIETKPYFKYDHLYTGAARLRPTNNTPPLHRRRKHSNQSTGSEGTSDSDLRSPELPRSPMIRSRYPRKLKNDQGLKQLLSDASKWKATPPKTFIRPRRSAGEPPPNGESRPRSAGDLELVRHRSKSDCSQFRKPELPESCLEYQDPRSVFDRYMAVKQKDKQLPVSDMICHFEQKSSVSSVGSCSPVRLESPGPLHKPTRSPVRKLKTAEELLRDSEHRKSSGIKYGRSKSATRAEIKTALLEKVFGYSSSDKENDRESFNKVKKIVQQLSQDSKSSRECSPAKEVATRGRSISTSRVAPNSPVQRAVRKYSTPTKSETMNKPPLKDVTNGRSPVQKLKLAFSEAATASRSRSVSPKITHKHSTTVEVHKTEYPKSGTVSKVSEKFQADASGYVNVNAMRHTSQNPSDVTGSNTSTPDSSETVWQTRDRQQESKKTQSAIFTENPKEYGIEKISHSSPGTPVPGTPDLPSPTHKGRKFFGRKTAAAPKGNTVKMLCKQAISMDMADSGDEYVKLSHSGSEKIIPVPPDAATVNKVETSPSTSDRRKLKARLLEASWLQKPKRFFKVSNVVECLSDMDTDSDSSV